MRRRPPDPDDNPAKHGLPADAIQFTTRDDVTLGGWWIPAAGAAQGAVIIAGGQNGSLDRDVPLAKPLHAAGFSVLLFDWRAHGRSEGEIVTLGALEQLDLLAALDYLEQTHGVTRAGVLGLSMGAGVGLMTAAYEPRIAALVADGAYPHLGGLLARWMQRRQGLPGPLANAAARGAVLAASLRSNLQIYRANPIETAPQVRAPVLLIHAAADDFVSEADISALRAALGGASDLWHVPHANHRDAWTQQPDEYARRVVAWFARYLAAP